MALNRPRRLRQLWRVRAMMFSPRYAVILRKIISSAGPQICPLKLGRSKGRTGIDGYCMGFYMIDEMHEYGGKEHVKGLQNQGRVGSTGE